MAIVTPAVFADPVNPAVLAGPSIIWTAAVLALAGVVALAASIVDMRTREIPDRLTVGALIAMGGLLGLAWLFGMVTGTPDPRIPLRAALLGAVIAAAYLGLALLPGRGLGGGDVKLIPTLAASLGWLGVDATVLGTLIAPFVLATLGILAGAVIAACRTWPIRLHLSGHLRVAFAPWCAAGWAVAVLVSAMAAGYG